LGQVELVRSTFAAWKRQHARPVSGIAVELRHRCRRVARVLAVLICAAMLTGCAVGPDFQPPPPPGVTGYLPPGRGPATSKPLPGQTLVAGAPIPERWWELFRSRHLNELITQGITHNTDLQAAEASVRVAQANALAQRGALFPLVTADFNTTRQKQPLETVTPTAATNASTFSLHTAQVTVTYVADVFGGTRRQIESADALAEAQAFQREAVYITLTANIANAAIQEASLRGQIAATRRVIALAERLLEILRRQHELGQTALTDVATQETALAQARLLLPPLERQLAQQQDLLAFLTGRFPAEDVAARFEIESFRLPRAVPLSLPADLVRQRPDIRVAEANLHSASAQIGVAIANRLPKITLTANAGSSALALSKLFSPGTGFWMVAGDAAQTVFDAGALYQRQRAAEEAFNQSMAQYRGVVLTAFQNVADTLRALEADSRALSAATAAERAASQNIDLLRKQVEEGQISLPILITAQTAYLQTQLARVQAQAARLADTVALFQALGGGWWNRPPPVATADGALQ
jgi:NodT family efflux transporter outer membrane factor (OMF) lipoprotein